MPIDSAMNMNLFANSDSRTGSASAFDMAEMGSEVRCSGGPMGSSFQM